MRKMRSSVSSAQISSNDNCWKKMLDQPNFCNDEYAIYTPRLNLLGPSHQSCWIGRPSLSTIYAAHGPHSGGRLQRQGGQLGLEVFVQVGDADAELLAFNLQLLIERSLQRQQVEEAALLGHTAFAQVDDPV